MLQREELVKVVEAHIEKLELGQEDGEDYESEIAYWKNILNLINKERDFTYAQMRDITELVADSQRL